jgi:hypothetical protein
VSAVAGEVEKGGVFETLPAGAATPAGRRNCGLAEEIARVERAALDWGLHADALEGRFVQALLKAIEETGKTNLATLGDLEALLEKARREGEADRRRIERMIEAGLECARYDASRRQERRCSERARQKDDRRRGCGDLRPSIEGARREVPAMADLRTETSASSVRV